MRYIVCGQTGSGTEKDPYRPAIVDDIPTETVTLNAGTKSERTFEQPICGWAANQRFLDGVPQAEFIVTLSNPDVLEKLTASRIDAVLEVESKDATVKEYEARESLEADKETELVEKESEKQVDEKTYIREFCDTDRATWPSSTGSVS